MSGISPPPLLVTCLLDNESQNYFQTLRDRYFPPERNIVPAHLSFFHNLPTAEREQIERDLHQVCARRMFGCTVCAITPMGGGVVFAFESKNLSDLHAELASRWKNWLIPQDRQKFKPHVVVQNKVTKEVAQQTFDLLCADFEPFSVQAVGLCLWTYAGGPWRMEKEFLFETL